MSDFQDTLNAIDDVAVHHCGHCDAPLGPEARSWLFCGTDHQRDYYAARSEPLVGYTEPSDIPAHILNQREMSSPETTPQGSFHRQWLGQWVAASMPPEGALRIALHTSSPPVTQVEDDGDNYAHGGWGRQDIQWSTPGMEASLVVVDELFRFDTRPLQEFFLRISGSIAEVYERATPILRSMGHSVEEANVDPRQRALEARRNRNTGPQQLRRAPRRIDPRRSR